MRIEKISVDALFGMFDHVIPMKMDDRITIVHGPNGFGKTVLLRMLDDLFNARFAEMRTMPFRGLRVDFDDRSALQVKREDNVDGKRGRRYQLSLEFSHGTSRKKLDIGKPVEQQLEFPLSVIDREVPELERTGPETWLHLPTGEELELDEVLERFAEQLPFGRKAREEEESWFKEIRSKVPTRFIETQRLLRYGRPRRARYPGYRPGMMPAVAAYATELASRIQQTLASYANLSQSLDRTFPSRLVASHPSPDLTLDHLRNELSSLEDKRSRLVDLGLLDRERELDFRDLQAIDERNRDVLSVYVKDAHEKLAVFDDLSRKLELFKRSINERFLYKEMSISSKAGFIFTTSDGNELPATKLSSGEQHEVVLFYELLFEVGRDSLILIDEPELSLHVLWQQQFLKDLSNITKLGEFDVLIATHSPQIIHDRWDLTVELKGPSSGSR